MNSRYKAWGYKNKEKTKMKSKCLSDGFITTFEYDWQLI